MNILIIGGSGFLSGTLACLALAHGHRVWAVTRGQRSLTPGAIALIADRRDQTAFAAAVASAGVVWDLAVDCIAYHPGDVQQDVAVLPPFVRHLVYISTDFVYDPAGRRFPQTEETEFYLATGYGGLKRAGEIVLAQSDTGRMAWTILRPCHIYGPGSQLGCLPQHGRDPQLIQRLRAGESLRLVGGGHFLQQPILARDLSQVILDVGGKATAHRRTFCAAGPDIGESQEYYRIIADILGVALKIDEVPVSEFRRTNPEAAPFLCHRIYDLSALKTAGIAAPNTPLAVGLREHVQHLLQSL